MTRFGMHVVLAIPPGYDLVDDRRCRAGAAGLRAAARSTVVDSMDDAFDQADIVYPKSWAPAAVMRSARRCCARATTRAQAELEQQALATNARFTRLGVHRGDDAATKGGKALYMHCLPADVTGVSCAAGEVSQRLRARRSTPIARRAGSRSSSPR
jgi:ornithine carbamoyltransferase